MTTTEQQLLGGKPITGEITRNANTSKKQKPIEEFLTALDAALQVPGVEYIQWNQYTPFFNDGDPCYFGMHTTSIKFVGDNENGDWGDGRYEFYFSAGSPGTVRFSGYGGGAKHTFTGADHDALKAFHDALWNGAHIIDLEKYFGDHAQITATTAGFHVEEYEHE